ncbi:MAG: leucyl aminopeptidase family protein [Rhodospirillales bacterium]|nr:leucyl aminopeptidase family protein [Rhodospirillales bacterium]
MASGSVLVSKAAKSVSILPLGADGLKVWLKRQPTMVRKWVQANGFQAAAGSLLFLSSRQGEISHVLFGVSGLESPWDWAVLPKSLPEGTYRIDGRLKAKEAEAAALGWLLGGYRFDGYKKDAEKPKAKLLWPTGADKNGVTALFEAICLVRDLVSTPASDLGPRELASEARKLARRFKARCKVISGPALEKAGYPAVYAVGKGSARPPCLIDISWGRASHPLVTLVGKGVCFDSGGLDLKPSSAMKLMKKDMGGAAHVLALAHLVMSAKLPLRLRVLIPAVENMPGPNAMRPMDVLKTRLGLRVEVGNTDAEGRLILADALCEASRGKPDLIVDFATLTGAARSALGPDLPALFSNDDGLAKDLLEAAQAENDPLWRLPLWSGYEDMLKSKIADLNSAPDSPFAGAITAALFLQRFVSKTSVWVHLDVFAWNGAERPGRPVGGEAMGLRAVFALLKKRYKNK